MLIQHHVDDISKMTEEVLESSFNRLKSTLRDLRKKGTSSKMVQIAEEEFCYLYREREVRTRRNVAHSKWMDKRRSFSQKNY